MFENIKNKIIPQNDQKSKGLSKSLDDNIKLFKDILKDNDTIIYRKIENRNNNKLKCCLIFVDGMVDKALINDNIISPIMESEVKEITFDTLQSKIIASGDMQKVDDLDEMIHSVLYGNSLVLVEGYKDALLMDTLGWSHRSIKEPPSENVVRGPREGFTECININLSLIRRKILSPDLKFKYRDIGERTKTKVCLCYIDGLANEKIIKELNERLDKIDIDGILESGYIEELIKDAPLSPFHTVGNTERPDVVAADLLEGRIALVVDGTPFVLTLPYLFIEYFQMNEDYYNSFIFASLNRVLRIFAFFLTTSIPAIYVALVTYHQEMIPTPLIISIAAAHEGVPFPTIFEALVLGIAFEILREAGIRLPQPIGAAISIVGALVLGEALVSAKFASAPMVIVIALTGITSFMIPKMLGPLIIVRYAFLILASILGLYGYIFGVIGLFIHLMSLRSFGVPYMLNTASFDKEEIKDTTIRAPWWYMHYRPKLIGKKNYVRSKDAKR